MLIKNIKSLIGIIEGPLSLKKGGALSHIESLDNAYLLIEDELIVDYGKMDEAPPYSGQELDAKGSLVLPSWCDSHTHIVYAHSREGEFVARIMGKSYEEIANEGGGILNSARALQMMSEDELYESAKTRLEEVISMGTGAIEIKSGYGLTFESEMKMLKVIKRLRSDYPVLIKATFLGAHAYPREFKENHEGYLKELIEVMLPYVAENKLADYCDVFCDRGYFSPDETDRILKAAAAFGMKAKIHANELGRTGGVQVGVSNNAISVDHLEEVGEEEIQLLSSSDTIPTLLPSTSFFLNIPYAPAREMIKAGLGICLASDYNPGSTPSGKIPFILSLACLKMGLLPSEAFNAVTINGACAIESEEIVGSITRGKRANLIITKDIPSLDYLPYSFGSDSISQIVLKGKIWQG